MTKTKKKIFKTETTKKKIIKKIFPAKLDKKQKTEGYYQCLCQETQKGLKGSIIQATKFCKNNSTEVVKKRNDEINKIMKSYQQIGVSLTKLLKH
ncbi:MAG: hypothetical protein LBR43_02585 [Spiroplasmataceae bacterium]|jgi:hypothetical protein|nr:hypothetical protein [Spiroplasmataceae bacterium]